jgi:hypothetical protein
VIERRPGLQHRAEAPSATARADVMPDSETLPESGLVRPGTVSMVVVFASAVSPRRMRRLGSQSQCPDIRWRVPSERF